MSINRFFRKIFHPRVEFTDNVSLVYVLSLVVGLLSTLAAAMNLPVPDNGYYVGFISKSRIHTTYRELLIQFSEE